MKKLLLSVALLATINSFGQDLLFENFEGLTLGPIDGQNGWTEEEHKTSSVISANGGQALEIVSLPTATGTGTIPISKLIKNINWSAKEASNNIIEFSFDLFTSTTNANDGFTQIYIKNVNDLLIAGYLFDHITNELKAYYIYDNQGVSATGATPLGPQGTPLILPENSKVPVKTILDLSTNEYTFEFNGGVFGPIGTGVDFSLNDEGVYDKFEVVSLESTETSDYAVVLDNIIVEAINTNTASTNSVVASKFAVFPNPSNGSDVVNFTGDNIQATGASIFNLLGKKVMTASQSELANKQINISTLAKGMYLLNIETNEGVATKKIIKN